MYHEEGGEEQGSLFGGTDYDINLHMTFNNLQGSIVFPINGKKNTSALGCIFRATLGVPFAGTI